MNSKLKIKSYEKKWTQTQEEWARDGKNERKKGEKEDGRGIEKEKKKRR